MSALQQGVLRELVLFEAAQAQLLSLQSAKVGERHTPSDERLGTQPLK
jgi:hypothetical protein